MNAFAMRSNMPMINDGERNRLMTPAWIAVLVNMSTSFTQQRNSLPLLRHFSISLPFLS